MSSFCLLDLEHRQTEFRQSIWLPSETWVDVFKFLPRRDLLRHVQPSCHRFHTLADHHVHNLHIILHFRRFVRKLQRNSRKANKQVAELAASDASLAEHFWLGKDTNLWVDWLPGDNPAKAKKFFLRRCEAQKCILRHSMDLFRGCLLELMLVDPARRAINRTANPSQFLAYLALLQPIRPFCIEIVHAIDLSELHPDQLLRDLTLLNCPRLIIHLAPQHLPRADSICNWLHYLSIDTEAKDPGDRMRMFKLPEALMPSTCAEIIVCCKEHLLQSKSDSDQRTFMFMFHSRTKQVPFRIEHTPTREVLHLELYQHIPDFPEYTDCHLRRCLITDQTATTDHFDERDFFCRTCAVNDRLLESSKLTLHL